jgi:hypothetical protein
VKSLLLSESDRISNLQMIGLRFESARTRQYLAALIAATAGSG